MGKYLAIIIFLLSAPQVCFGGATVTAYKISFKTLSCDGSKGMASIDADRLVKLQSVKCDPNDPVKEVWQALVTGEPGSGLTYRVFNTTQEEAEKIQKAMDDYQAAKKKSLEDSTRIIINK